MSQMGPLPLLGIGVDTGACNGMSEYVGIILGPESCPENSSQHFSGKRRSHSLRLSASPCPLFVSVPVVGMFNRVWRRFKRRLEAGQRLLAAVSNRRGGLHRWVLGPADGVCGSSEHDRGYEP